MFGYTDVVGLTVYIYFVSETTSREFCPRQEKGGHVRPHTIQEIVPAIYHIGRSCINVTAKVGIFNQECESSHTHIYKHATTELTNVQTYMPTQIFCINVSIDENICEKLS